MPPLKTGYVTYEDLTLLTGISRKTIQQHASRGQVDIESLESVVLFVARHSRLDFQLRILESMLRRKAISPMRKKIAKRKAKPSKTDAKESTGRLFPA